MLFVLDQYVCLEGGGVTASLLFALIGQGHVELVAEPAKLNACFGFYLSRSSLSTDDNRGEHVTANIIAC